MNWKVWKKSIHLRSFKVLTLIEGNLEDQKELLEIKVNYIEEEIDIRVESIIMEIEDAAKRLKGKLKKIKEEVKLK